MKKKVLWRMALCLLAILTLCAGMAAIAEGDSGAPVISVLDNTSDSSLAFTIYGLSEPCEMSVRVLDMLSDENEIFSWEGEFEANGSKQLPDGGTISISPEGVYQIIATATNGDGDTFSSMTFKLPVGAYAETAGRVRLAAAAEQTVVNAGVPVWASANDAQRLLIFSEDGFAHNIEAPGDYSQGLCAFSYCGFETPGDKHIYAVAIFDDGSTAKSDPVAITVSEPRGTIGDVECVAEADATQANFSFQAATLNGDWSEEEAPQVHYWVEIYESGEDNPYIGDQYEEPQSFHFDIGDGGMLPGHVYTMFVSAWADDCKGSLCWQSLLIPGGEPEIELTVNDSAEDQTMNVHDEAYVSVSAPGANAVRVFNGSGWELVRFEDEDERQEGRAEVRADISTPGRAVLFAMAYYGDQEIDEETNWDDLDAQDRKVSNQVVCNLQAERGSLPAPVLDVSGLKRETDDTYEVTRGDAFEAIIANREDYEGYEGLHFLVEIQPLDGDDTVASSDWYDGWDNGDRIRVSTTRMEEGWYRLWAIAYASGHMDTTSELLLHAVNQEAPVVLNVSNPEPVSGEGFLVSASAPGAEWIQLYCDGESWDDPNGGDTFEDMWFLRSGEYTLHARAAFSDGDDLRFVDSDPVVVNVSALGELAPAAVNAESMVPMDENIQLSFSFDAVTETLDGESFNSDVGYDFMLRRMEDDAELYREDGVFPGETYVYDDTDELRIGTYRLTVFANAYGYDGSESNFYFVIAPEPMDGDIRLVLAPAPEAETNVSHILTGQNVRCEAYAPGASAVRVWTGTEWRHKPGEDFLENIHFDEPGMYAVFAEASYDTGDAAPWMDAEDFDWDAYWEEEHDWNEELNWTGTTEVVLVEVVVPEEACGPFSFALDNHSVPQGANLPLTIEASENADRYHIRILPEDSNEELYFLEVRRPGGHNVTTGTLEPGRYRVSVVAGAESFQWADGASEDNTFEVTDCEVEQYFQVSAAVDPEHEMPTIPINAEFTVSMYYENAQAVRLADEEGNVWENWDGAIGGMGDEGRPASFSWDSGYEAGVHGLVAQYLDDDGEWHQFDYIEMYVTVNDEPMAAPVVTLNAVDGVLAAGDDLIVSVATVPHGTDYYTKVSYEGEGWPIYEQGKSVVGSENVINFMVPGGNIPEANRVYEVEVWAESNETGYRTAWAVRQHVLVKGTFEDERQVTLNIIGHDGENGKQVLTNENFAVTVDAPGATAIAFFGGETGQHNWYWMGDFQTCSYSIGAAGEYPLYALASFDEGVEEADGGVMKDGEFHSWEEWDWQNELNWSACSNVLMLSVTGDDALDAPTVELVNNPVPRGTFLEANIPEVENAQWYDVHVRERYTETDEEGNDHQEERDISGNRYYASDVKNGILTAMVPTNGLEPEGDYALVVFAGAKGYAGNENRFEDGRFQVTASQEAAIFELATDTAVTWTEVPFMLSVPGATYLRIVDGNGPVMDPFEEDAVMQTVFTGGNPRTWRLAVESSEDGENWQRVEELEPRTLTVTSAHSFDLENISVEGLNGIVAEDEDIAVAIHASNATQIDFRIEPIFGGMWLLRGDTVDGDAARYVIRAGRLMTGEGYRAIIDIMAPDYEQAHIERKFVIAPQAEGDTLTLAVEPAADAETGAVNVAVRQTVRYSAYAPGAVAVRVWTGEQWQTHPEDTVEGDVSFLDPGSYAMLAQASYDTENAPWYGQEEFDWDEFWSSNSDYDMNTALSWNETTLPIPIEVALPEQECGAFDFALNADSVARGDSLMLTIDPSENAEVYKIDIMDETGQNWYYREVRSAGSYALTTSTLEPGSYRVYVTAEAEACWPAEGACVENDGAFTVTEAGDAPFFRTSVQEDEDGIYTIRVNEEFTVSIYQPNAFAVRLIVNGNEQDVWGQWDGAFGGLGDWGRPAQYRWNNADTFVLTAQYQAEEGGAWSDIDSITLNAVANETALDAPVLALNAPDGVLAAGENLVVTVTTVENGDNYSVRVHPEGDDRNALFEQSKRISGSEEAISFTIRGEYLQPANRVYVVEAWTDSDEPGYASAWAARGRVLVLDDSFDTERQVTLEVIGHDDGEGGKRTAINEDFAMLVDAPGATAIGLYTGSEMRYFIGDTAVYNCNIGEPGCYPLYAVASYDEGVEPADEGIMKDDQFYGWDEWNWEEEMSWTGRSPIVPLTVTALTERLAIPTFTYPDTVTRGEMMPVEIQLAENVRWCDVRIRQRIEFIDDSDNPQTDWRDYGYTRYEADAAEDGRLTVKLPTGALEPQGEYAIVVSVSAPGYQYEESGFEDGRFTLAEAGDEPLFELEQHTVPTATNVAVALYVPGASQVRVVNTDGREEGMWDGDGATGAVYSGGNAGTRTLIAQYRTEESDWQDVEGLEPQTLTTTSSHRFDEANVSVEGIAASVSQGQDLRVQVHAENAGEINFHLDNAEDGQWIMDFDYSSGEDAVYIIRGSMLEAGHAYRAFISISARDYEQLDLSYCFYVEVDEADSGVVLKVNGSTDADQEAQLNQGVSVDITAPKEAVAVRYMVTGWRNHRNWPSNSVEGDILNIENWMGPGTMVLYAQACYSDIDFGSFTQEDWDNLDWENDERLEWGGPSNIIRLKVTVPEGMLPLNYTFVTPEVERGDMARIRLEDVMEGANYNAALLYYDEESQQFERDNDKTFEWDGVDSIYLPTGGMDPGVYSLELGAYGKPNWQDNGARAYDALTVLPVEPGEIVFHVSGEDEENHVEVSASQNLTFSCYAPGAVRLELLDRRDEENPFFEWNDEEGFSLNWKSGKGDYSLYVRATYEDGNTVDSVEKTLKVNPIGALPTPDCMIPGSIYLGWELPMELRRMANADWGYHVEVYNAQGDQIYGTGEGGDRWDGSFDHWVYLSDFDDGNYMFEADDYTVSITYCSSQYEDSTYTRRVRFVDDTRAGRLILPAALDTIDEEAFYGADFSLVDVPSGVKTIGAKAFANCSNLCIVDMPGNVTIAEDAFEGCEFVVFRCPEDSKAARYAEEHGYYIIIAE